MNVLDDEQKRRLQVLSTKLKDVSQSDLKLLRQAFDRRLAHDGKSRIEWLRERGMADKESLLSNVLSGRLTSKPLMQEIIRYLIG